MTSKQRAYLKSLAQTMEPIFQIGKNSLTPENTKAIAEALEARELIKVSVLQNCMDDPKEIASLVAERTRSQVVQVIGKKIVLYKEGKKKRRKSFSRNKEVLMVEGRKQIGIMGGTFDPVHNAHLVLAEQAYSQFSLDEVWMMPNGNPPHKREYSQADVGHRMEMVRLAIQNVPYLRLCGLEQSENSYHYTYETMSVLNSTYPDHQFYFIMGADSLFDFEDWKEPAIICRECVLLAATRDHCRKEKILRRIEELKEKYNADIRILNTPTWMWHRRNPSENSAERRYCRDGS